MKLNISLLEEMLEKGYVRKQQHPEAPLWIYNYTVEAQYERVWNDITLQCRGLILGHDYAVVARPFGKFFNLGEQENQHIPNEPFEVYEKMDGSLGILYWHNDAPFIASRGSFASEQSVVANQILQEKYRHLFTTLDPEYTYLFEIIYPENRIVVNYGDIRDLVLLGAVHTATGEEAALPNLGFPVVKKYDGLGDIHQLRQLEAPNREGFVIRYQNGLRYKVKFQEYVRLHFVLTQTSAVTVWEKMMQQEPFGAFLELVPDEFYQWVQNTRDKLTEAYLTIEQQCQKDFKVLEDRKATAAYFLTCAYPAILFKMLDQKPYDQIIWNMVKPAYERPWQAAKEPL